MTSTYASGARGFAPSNARGQIEELEQLAHLLDSRWRVPGTGFRFGLDGVIGLIPGLGDVSTGLVSAYLVWRAREFGLPGHVLARMAGNVFVDVVVGSVPVVGSIIDFGFKANTRNMRLMRRHLERHTQSA